MDAYGAISLKKCPLKNLEAHVAGSAIFTANEFGSLTLQEMEPCENCVGHYFMRTEQAAVYSDGSKGAPLGSPWAQQHCSTDSSVFVHSCLDLWLGYYRDLHWVPRCAMPPAIDCMAVNRQLHPLIYHHSIPVRWYC